MEGKKLFRLSVEQYVGENVLNEVKEKVIERYGEPDCSATGKDGGSIELKWGDCNKNDRYMEHTTKGEYIRFLYDKAQIFLTMENIKTTDKIDHFVLTLDEKTRLKEVLELDF